MHIPPDPDNFVVPGPKVNPTPEPKILTLGEHYEQQIASYNRSLAGIEKAKVLATKFGLLDKPVTMISGLIYGFEDNDIPF